MQLNHTVTVTKKHLDEGRSRSCTACPFALAITECVPGSGHIQVWEQSGMLHGGGLTLYFALPDFAANRISAIDRGVAKDEDYPFTFNIKLDASLYLQADSQPWN